MLAAPTYDPLDTETLIDPYPALAALRAYAPASWHEGMRSWVLTRYGDCVAVLRDHEGFARDRRRVGVVVAEPSLSVQSMDPPDQAPVRGLFVNALRAQDIRGIEHRAYVSLAERLQRLAVSESFDVMADVAVPFSLGVVSDLLGVEQPDVRSFSASSDAIMRSMDAGLDPAVVAPGICARAELTALVDSWFRSSTGPGLLADVRAHADAGDSAIDLYIRNTARVMFQGGYSTMVAAVGNVVDVLLRHPWALDAMRDPTVLNSGVDELVRFEGPVQGTSRIATRTCEIGGSTVHDGDIVLVHFAGANRDPAQFRKPNQLFLDRAEGRHLGFGWGTHSCIGTVSAQAALRALIRALHEQPCVLRATGAASRRRTATMRVFDHLPATFRPVRGGATSRSST